MRETALLGLTLDSATDAAAAAAAVVDHVAGDARLLPAVYLARGGRLRCAALRGYWQARDVTFDASLLNAGANTIKLTVPAGPVMAGVEYDYLRLELDDRDE